MAGRSDKRLVENMSYSRHPLHIAIVAFLVRGFGGRTVIIPETASVIENTSLRLDCFYMDYSTLPTTTTCRWSIAGNGTTTLIAIFYQNCLFVNVNEEIYNFECTNNTANSMIIKSTDRNMHGTVYSCSYFVNGITATGNATIRVSVPVSDVNLIQPETDVVITTENGKVTITCNATAAHPKPNIAWYTDSHTPSDYRDDVEITANTTMGFDFDGYLYRVMSNLTFYPTRYHNGSHIYCIASNIEQQSITSTRKALLYVQYPPSTPVFFLRANASVKNVLVIINNTLTIRCSSRGNPSPSYIWTTAQNKEMPGEYFTIENSMRTDSGAYRCMAYNVISTAGEIRNHSTSASIEVTVLYPPDVPKFYYLRPGITKEEIFNSVLQVVKEDNVSVLCTSTGKPPPTSAWNRTVSNNTLYLNSIKTDASHTCTSSNVMTETEGGTKNGLVSRKLNIHVLYPPATPIIKIFQSEDHIEALDVVNVVENTNILLECSAQSKPPSNFSWSHPVNEVRNNSSKHLFVNRIQRNQSGAYTCHAANEMVRSFGNVEIGINERSTYVDVLYPPDAPTYFYIEHKNKHRINTLPLKVVEGDNVSVLCNATGNPVVTSLWVDNDDTNFLTIVSVEINHPTNFTCISFNTMNDKFGVSRNGTSLNNFSILVYYPPRNPVIHIQMQPNSIKLALNNTDILEGSDFRLYCHAVSNPSPSYKWTGPVTSGSSELFVSNVQRHQSGPYICYVKNEMERSFGNIETGRNNRSIFFNVLYKAAILYFGASDFENNKNTMTVNQREETRIMCRVVSNPFSNNTIFFNGRLVNESIRSDTVSYNLINSTCSDAGRYICKGKNEYNYEADASKELFLYVKCLPQSSADQPPEKNVSAALSDSAVFRFHAAPYYDPGKTQFRWFKQGNDSRIWLRNGTKTYISSSDIHSVLRISDVSETDYGMYLLQYNNSVGMNNFTFYLYQINQTVSVEIHRSNDRNYLPVVLGIVIAVLVIVGVTSGLVIYMRRRKQKTDSDNGNRSYENDFRMNAKTDGSDINRSPVYEGLKSVDEREYLEMKEQAYEILKPTGSSDTQEPVYTNLKL